MEHEQDDFNVIQKEFTRKLKLVSCGAFAGICHVVAFYPLDTIKTRMQVMGHTAGHVASYPQLYQGSMDCMVKTWKFEGVRGIFRGMSPFLLATTPLVCAGFTGLDTGKIAVRKLTGKDPTAILSYPETIVSQSLSIGVSSSLVTPAERVKCLIQIQPVGQPQTYKGPLDCAKTLVKQGGFSNLYKGYWITYLRGISQVSVYYPSIRVINYYMTPEGGKLSKERAFGAGVIAGAVVWTAILPIDAVKTILQTAPQEGTHPKTTKDIFTSIIKNEGIAGLYRGYTPVMFRTVFGMCAIFGGFNVAMSALS